MSIKLEEHKITVGIPVYNAEKFIRKRLDNILSQTFQDFVIIIYDNSTDLTPKICKEYANKDKRIHYTHEKNLHTVEFAFNYVLQKSISKYFVWAAADDKWDDKFLEKNIHILNNESDIVGSIGQVKRYGPIIEEFLPTLNDSFLKRIYKKIRRHFRHFGHVSINANSYEQRSGQFLRQHEELSIYAVFRTKELQKSFVFGTKSWKKTMLNILKYGKFNVENEVLWYWYTGSSGVDNLINQYEKKLIPLKELLFPSFEYAFWCIRNIGLRFFLKNIDFFILYNMIHSLILIGRIVTLKKNKSN